MTVKDLHSQGVIKFLYNKGLLSIDVLCYFEYVEYYNSRREAGETYTQAVLLSADKFGVSISTIKRAVRILK